MKDYREPREIAGFRRNGESGAAVERQHFRTKTMPIKTYRPITPTLRFKTSLVNDDLTTDKPHKPLLAVKQRTGGRRNKGDMTIRHQGGGHKQMLRLILRAFKQKVMPKLKKKGLMLNINNSKKKLNVN